ncbi:hypothetical protein P153DRAFT_279079 [Dothidotthia symphoricarpi CBS 119687]|uniref:Uncharacterized protein n=1 Tax=Dothidotthia symphoricarpi CBS 119687 TaxID=1392245 RepID=A0A6A6AU93_9PLEO|nr:uncharacterized protein P153DRAFT_279079 [Dothidotthia symphoricarpi CBS 119687]KAF2134768.1 hypothetical protein P153DRAFT_279079 [Dothidotthia symphoricarpi CBS 119687]
MQEAAPAYDYVQEEHPMKRFIPSGMTSAYAAVSQEDDVETHAHSNTHDYMPTPPETIAQSVLEHTMQPHIHCEQCDVRLEARERRANQRHCCKMVAVTFIAVSVCLLILGIIVSSDVTRKGKHGRD